jgi:protein-tyrosine phosphatase
MTTADTSARPESTAAPPKRRRTRWILGILLAALAIPFLLEVVRVTLGSNFHAVVEGRCYRAAQPSGASLENYVRTYGIRTVLNLRGDNKTEDWFVQEEEIAQRTKVHFVSINLSASDKPLPDEISKLVESIEQGPEPMLLHCNGGSDRSGLASACFLLLKTGATLEEARSQLSLRFGHFPWGRAACQGQVLDQYKDWLDSQGLTHQPEHFRHWATKLYVKDDWPDLSALVVK